MPTYYFDVADGTRLPDSSGLECSSDADALLSARVIAREIGEQVPESPAPRRIVVLNESGDEIGIVPIDRQDQQAPASAPEPR